MVIERTAMDYVKRIVELEAHRDQLKEENAKLKAREVTLKEKLDSEESKWREEEEEIRAKCWAAELEKRKLEVDLKVAVAAAATRVSDDGDDLARKLKLAEAEAKRLKRNLEIDLNVNCDLEIQKEKEVADAKVLELLQKLEVLEKEKEDGDAEICRLTVEKSILAERVGDLNDTLENQKKRMWLVKKGIEKFVERSKASVMERQEKGPKLAELAHKLRVEEEKTLELTRKIEVLEGEKGKMEAEYCLLKEDSRYEAERFSSVNKALKVEKKSGKMARDKITALTGLVKRISVLERVKEDEKMAMEEESKLKVSELTNRIEVLEREKEELESEVCQAKEKSEEFKRILNEKVAVEVEKTIMEAESKKMVTLKKKHSNKALVSTIGPKSVAESVAEPKQESVDPDKECSTQVYQRRNAEALGCSVESQAGPKRWKSGLEWTTPEKMFNAFKTNDELCVNSVCALYRKHKSLGCWKNCSTPSINNGFKPPYEGRGMALGELLTSGDPEGRLKISLEEFGRLDPHGLYECWTIARHHYLELFEIHINNLDTLLMPGDDMS